MHSIDLRRLDLNLLKTFDALAREGSVTRAADYLGLGQPAVSQALSRLRVHLQDELFQRGPGGMVPTPRAEALIGPLREALRQIELSIYGDQAFDPASFTGAFTIGVSDFVAAAVMPGLLRAAGERLPGAAIQMRNADKESAPALLLSGEIDLAVGLFAEPTEWLRRRRLFRETHLCVFDPAQLPCAHPISLEDFVTHPHILVSLKGDRRGFIDDLLAQRGLSRRVAVTTPYFLLVGELLRALPMLAVLPRSYAQGCAGRCAGAHAEAEGLSVGPVPLPLTGFDVSVLSRASDDRDPAVQALLQLLIETGRPEGG